MQSSGVSNSRSDDMHFDTLSSVTCTVYKPDGTSSTLTVVRAALGTYTALLLALLAGHYVAVVEGAMTGQIVQP